MTKETLDKLPNHVREAIEAFRTEQKNGVYTHEIANARSAWYLRGLRDAGLISSWEFRALFNYTTI